jgi:hypothetical protein
MSQKRHTAFFDRSGNNYSQITTLTRDYPAGRVIPLHNHDFDQLVYDSRGVMAVRTSDSSWVVPNRRAVWIPAAVPHTIAMSGTVAMRTLCLRPRLARNLPRNCRVVNVSPLLKQLILHVSVHAALKKTVRCQRHLMDVVLNQLKTLPMVPLQYPNPFDPRGLRITEGLLADPSDRRALLQICKTAGAGKRTVEE